MVVVVVSSFRLFALVAPAVDDIARLAVAVDEVAGVTLLMLALLSPVLTGMGSVVDGSTGRVVSGTRGSSRSLLVLLDGGSCHHFLDLDDCRCGRVVRTEHRLDHLHERFGGDDVLQRGGEDVLAVHIRL